MDLLNLISPEICRIPLTANDRLGAIRELVSHLADQDLIDDVERITRTVWDRELERTTGIGEGLAVPHGRCETIERLVIAMGVPEKPIDFQSFDHKPVQFIVLVLSPPDAISDHIQVLGGISRLMTDRGFRRRAMAAQSAATLSDLFRSALSTV
jgi:mannitol/fructose-specific phosphotransferase system IIA component (Ntr-type)